MSSDVQVSPMLFHAHMLAVTHAALLRPLLEQMAVFTPLLMLLPHNPHRTSTGAHRAFHQASQSNRQRRRPLTLMGPLAAGAPLRNRPLYLSPKRRRQQELRLLRLPRRRLR